MSDEAEHKSFAWQPLTFRGVSLFGQASLTRLFLLQLAVVVATVATLIWFLGACWIPALERSIGQTRAGAYIEAGRLVWPGEQTERLSDGPFLEFIVTPRGDRSIGQIADLQVELSAGELKFHWMFGYIAFPYPSSARIPLNPEDAAASWGAWKEPALTVIGIVVALWLLVVWYVLAAIYTVPALLFGFYADRPTTFSERFKIAGAALLPAALFFDAGIFLYGVRQLTLVGLLVAGVLHILLGWAYLAIAMLQLPRVGAGDNPFARGSAGKPRRRG